MKNKNFKDKLSEKDQHQHDAPNSQEERIEEQDNIEYSLEETLSQNEELRAEIEELKDKNIRLMAEFDNYRKRTLKERTELLKTASESVLKEILPIIDDFERALKAMETAKDIKAVEEGVELIYEKFIAFLAQNGIKEIPTENETFNPDLHEAVTTFPAQDEDMKGKIMDCVSKGYVMNDKVIRFPKVIVCS